LAGDSRQIARFARGAQPLVAQRLYGLWGAGSGREGRSRVPSALGAGATLVAAGGRGRPALFPTPPFLVNGERPPSQSQAKACDCGYARCSRPGGLWWRMKQSQKNLGPRSQKNLGRRRGLLSQPRLSACASKLPLRPSDTIARRREDTRARDAARKRHLVPPQAALRASWPNRKPNRTGVVSQFAGAAGAAAAGVGLG